MLPTDFDEPRRDLRPPQFHAGFALGTVPYTRYRVYTASVLEGYWAFLTKGVIIQSTREVTDPDAWRNCNAQCQGYFDWQGQVVRINYQWNMLPLPANFTSQIFVNQLDLGTAFWRLTRTANDKMSIPVAEYPLFSDGIGAAPDNVRVDRVLEWSRPSEYWPGSIIGRESA